MTTANTISSLSSTWWKTRIMLALTREQQRTSKTCTVGPKIKRERNGNTRRSDWSKCKCAGLDWGEIMECRAQSRNKCSTRGHRSKNKTADPNPNPKQVQKQNRQRRLCARKSLQRKQSARALGYNQGSSPACTPWHTEHLSLLLQTHAQVDSTWKGLLTQLANKLKIKSKVRNHCRFLLSAECIQKHRSPLTAHASIRVDHEKVSTAHRG